MKEEDPIQNPVDPEQVAANPGLLPYAHHVGSALIKPIDRGRVKGRALSAMYEQTDRQLDQIREQVELLAAQADAIRKRVEISEQIYQADTSFQPLVGHTYHLYRRADGTELLSMVAPEEWGRSSPYEFVATARLLADHTWEVER